MGIEETAQLFIADRSRCNLRPLVVSASGRLLYERLATRITTDLAACCTRNFRNEEPAFGNGLSPNSLQAPGLQALRILAGPLLQANGRGNSLSSQRIVDAEHAGFCDGRIGLEQGIDLGWLHLEPGPIDLVLDAAGLF